MSLTLSNRSANVKPSSTLAITAKAKALRAEGRAAVQRERLNGYVRFAKAMYDHYVNLAQTAWNFIRGLFRK